MRVGLRSLHLLSAAVLLAYFTWFFLPKGFTDMTVGGGGFWMCLDYVRDGTLYGGQPYCAQTPVIYYFAYALSRVFGEGNLLNVMRAVVVLASVFNYLLIRDILIQRKIHQPAIYTLLYVLMVYRFMSFMTSTIAVTFLVAGFYALYYSKHRLHGFAAGIAFTLAFFTKYTTAVPVAVLILYYPVKNRSSYSLRAAGFSLAVLFASFILLNQLLPNMLAYTYYAHWSQMDYDMVSGLKLLWEKRNLNFFAAAIIFSALSYAVAKGFYGRETIVYPLTQLSVVLNGMLFIRLFGDIRIGSHYNLPAFPFLVMAYMVVWNKSQKLFALLFMATVLFPAIYTPEIYGSPLVDASRWALDAEAGEAAKAIEYGLHFIPPQKGHVLTEAMYGSKDVFTEYGIPIDSSRVVVIPSGERDYPGFEDPAWAPILRTKLNVTLDYGQAYDYALTKDEQKIFDEIVSGKYSLIMMGPPAWASLQRITYQAFDYLRGNYCLVFVPDFEYVGSGRTDTTLMFRDAGDCLEMRAKMVEYYTRNYGLWCGIGPRALYVVHDVFKMNELELDPGYSCYPPETFKYHTRERNRTRFTDVLLVALLYYPTYYLLKKIGRANA